MEGCFAAYPFYKAEKPEISTGHRIKPKTLLSRVFFCPPCSPHCEETSEVTMLILLLVILVLLILAGLPRVSAANAKAPVSAFEKGIFLTGALLILSAVTAYLIYAP